MTPLDPEPLLAMYRGWPAGEVAAELGVARETVQRWRSGTRRIDPRRADGLAVAAGCHALTLWPELDVVRVCEVCPTPLSGRADQRFCSVSCRDRDPKKRARKAAGARKRRRAETPEQREARLAQAREYKAAAARSVKVAQRAYYERHRERFIEYASEQRRRRKEAA
jgi:hypothetical protein